VKDHLPLADCSNLTYFHMAYNAHETHTNHTLVTKAFSSRCCINKVTFHYINHKLITLFSLVRQKRNWKHKPSNLSWIYPSLWLQREQLFRWNVSHVVIMLSAICEFLSLQQKNVYIYISTGVHCTVWIYCRQYVH
jgi:hypothetical protein